MVARLVLLETKRLEIDVKIFEIDAKTPKIIVAFFFCSTLLDSTCFTIFTVSFVSFILYFYCIIVFYFGSGFFIFLLYFSTSSYFIISRLNSKNILLYSKTGKSSGNGSKSSAPKTSKSLPKSLKSAPEPPKSSYPAEP